MSARWTGADLLCAALEEAGVRHAFGIPGAGDIGLFEALRTSPIHVVLTASELGAAFMAGAYHRTSGRLAVLLTSQGPGFTYALPGLAEARHDSAALLHLVERRPAELGRRFTLQEMDHRAVAAPLVKGTFSIGRAEEIPAVVAEACRLALSGDPGPVTVEVSTTALGAPVVPRPRPWPPAADPAATGPAPGGALEWIARTRRPVILAGQGALGAADAVRELAERWGAPVLTTLSGRGILPEDHPLALGFDSGRGGVEAVNALVDSADLVLALGCRLGHNGSAGFALRLPYERLVHVDADAATLNANYRARFAVQADAGAFLHALARHDDAAPRAWEREEVAGWRERVSRGAAPDPLEPRLPGAGGDAAGFVRALREALPRDAIVVTDTGYHQTLVRRHYPVLAPGGLLLPSDFQSMGFGIPAAIGAALAAPGRPVVAVVGDGGFAMTGMEMLTAVQERLPIRVIVWCDGYLGLIRRHQIREFGRTHAVERSRLDLEAFARAAGVRHLRWSGGDAAEAFRALGAAEVPGLVEVRPRDRPAVRALQARGAVRSWLHRRGVKEMARRVLRWGRAA